jgi:hypothetical protein
LGRTRRLTLREAAEVLGVSKEAVRKRAIRGSLPTDKDPDGRVYVYLDAGSDLRVGEKSEISDHRDQLIAQLQSEVEAWREESRRKDHIIAGLVERLPPQLEAPASERSEPRESPETATPAQERAEPRPASGGPQEGSQQMAMPEAGGAPLPRDQQTPSERPWWRRVFGGS